jgi:lipopolysaccharide export system protein LptC
MKNVEGDVTLKDGSWVGMMAPDGVLDANKHVLTLDGAIAVYSDGGYELHTSAATVDMQAATITGNRVVTGQGPSGTFRADRFRVDRHARQVFLHGNVHMTIDGRKATST